MVAICEALGLDLAEVMAAKPWWIPEPVEEELLCSGD